MQDSTPSKACSRCRTEKPLADFNKQAKSKDGRHYYCRDCQRGYARTNKAKYAAYSREWHAANADRKAELQRRWVAANALTKAEWQAAWKRANPERVREYHSRRRALIAGSSAEVVDLTEVWARSSSECYICGDPISADICHPDPMSKSLDHITPLSRGGAHVDENLAYVHLICNQRKNAKLLTL